MLPPSLSWGLTQTQLVVRSRPSPLAGLALPAAERLTTRSNFSLVGGPAFLTIASVTNVYAQVSDFITGFTGKVLYLGADGVLGGIGANADTVVIGPTAATACPLTPNCQGFAGSALLTIVGNYALDLSGNGGGTSGYGGNLAVAQVPLPGALALFASGLVGLGWLSKKRKKSLNVA